MALNDQQIEVINSNNPLILCLAGAGAGKTACLTRRIARLVNDGVDPKSILALTFTNAAAFEMGQRYRTLEEVDPTKQMPEFRTFHSFCYSLIIKDKDIREKLGYAKVPEICEDQRIESIKKEAKIATKCSLSDAKLTDPKVKLTPQEKFEKEVYDKAVRRMIRDENVITFDMLCYNVCALFQKNDPIVDKYKQRYKHVLVDEWQDTDPKQYKFLASFPSTTSIFCCGDALQCQPAGTQILMTDGSTKPIETIKPGDPVVSYNTREGYYNASSKQPNRVLQVGSRYADNIIKVSTNNHSSRYTKDHRTYCKINYESNKDKRCVYLMSNAKGWWRIGECSLFLYGGSDFGPRHRMHEEKGNRIWILAMCSNQRGESWLAEQTAAAVFGIPDTTWQFANVSGYTEDSLQTLYDRIANIEERARACLEYFGRDINYPFYDRERDSTQHISKLHIYETFAGCLMPGLMDVAVPEFSSTLNPPRLHNTYEQIISIENCAPDIVYSLDVDVNHSYVADGILTHNCIYQFRGTSNEFIKMQSKDQNWHKIRLFENYRSTNQICDFANKFSTTYADPAYRIAMHGQRDGDEVEVIKGSWTSYDVPVCFDHLRQLVKRLKSSTTQSAVLCRTNKEVDQVCKTLDEEGIVYVRGNKSSEAIDMLHSVLDDSYMIQWLSNTFLDAKKYGDYIRLAALQEEVTLQWFLDTFGSVTKINSHAKKIGSIRETMIDSTLDLNAKFEKVTKTLGIKKFISADDVEGTCTPQDFIQRILDKMEELEESKLYVGTIHSSKGLEYDTVYLMGVDDFSFQLGTEEMNNLYYVGVTRAKNHLVVFRR